MLEVLVGMEVINLILGLPLLGCIQYLSLPLVVVEAVVIIVLVAEDWGGKIILP
jgi:hypothetical protein